MLARRQAILEGQPSAGPRHSCFDSPGHRKGGKASGRFAGYVVTKTTLLDAVWGPVCVTDDSVTQVIRDIRKALCDQDQHFLRTVPRRGYRFSEEGLSVCDGAPWPALPRAKVFRNPVIVDGQSALIGGRLVANDDAPGHSPGPPVGRGRSNSAPSPFR